MRVAPDIELAAEAVARVIVNYLHHAGGEPASLHEASAEIQAELELFAQRIIEEARKP